MKGLIPDGVAKDIEEQIISCLSQMGIMFRIFSRVKTIHSLKKKIFNNIKYGTNKRIQDLIGIRVVLYFSDDIDIVHNVLSSLFTEREKDRSIDSLLEAEFCPVRYNIVYEIPTKSNFSVPNEFNEKIDNTFEIQIRTVLSEGWHEVEHDLRYKCKDDWNGHNIESRKLNGVYAAIDTNEWTMIKIFDEISYKHYKSQKWEAMLRQKFRLRLSYGKLADEISLEFNKDNDLAKKFYRINRIDLITLIHEKNFGYPINLDNIVYFSNMFLIKSEVISQISPPELLEEYGV